VHNVKQHSHTKHIDVQHHYIQTWSTKADCWMSFYKEDADRWANKDFNKNTFRSHWKQLEVVWLNEVHMQKKVDQV
jgi:hypothetical protein